jgi:hypothetical protein
MTRHRRSATTALLAVLLPLLLTACASPPPEGKVIAEDRFTELVVPGRTTRSELVAAFGPTHTVVFDSGMETWLYEADAGAGRHTELVLLIDRDGIVRKLRRRPAYPSDLPAGQRQP